MLKNWFAMMMCCVFLVGTQSVPAQDKDDSPSVEEELQKVADLGPGVHNIVKDKKDSLEISYQNALKGFLENHAQKTIEELLALVQIDINWQEGLAKTTLLKVFAALGHSHRLTLENRRKLSTIIFS